MSRLVHEAEDGCCIELTRWGRPVAVVLSVEEYERLTERRPVPLWRAITAFRDQHDLSAEDHAEAFRDLRSPDTGRDGPW